MKARYRNVILAGAALLLAAVASLSVHGQSGRGTEAGARKMIVHVVAQTPDNVLPKPGETIEVTLGRAQLALYDGGIEQTIEALQPDLSGARYVLVVDNSSNVPGETEEFEELTRALTKEIFVDDRVMVIAFNESAEILEEFTDDAKKLVEAAKLYKKKGKPRLYDALLAVVEDALRPQVGVSKRVVILVSDGFDNGSQMEHGKIVSLLQAENIMVYGLQIPDRTFGAPRAKKLGPKPQEAFRGLVEETGGRLFKFEDRAKAMALITDEVRNRWFQLAYSPKGVNPINERRLLVSPTDDKLVVRTKKRQPAQQ